MKSTLLLRTNNKESSVVEMSLAPWQNDQLLRQIEYTMSGVPFRNVSLAINETYTWQANDVNLRVAGAAGGTAKVLLPDLNALSADERVALIGREFRVLCATVGAVSVTTNGGATEFIVPGAATPGTFAANMQVNTASQFRWAKFRVVPYNAAMTTCAYLQVEWDIR